MSAARRRGAFGAVRSWWVAARALALVLALAIAAPMAGLAEDLAFHHGHDGADRTELALAAPEAAAEGAQRGDPGLGCHLHCGCHVAAHPAEADSPVPATASRATYARLSEAVSSVVADRLPRPPRA